MIGFLILAFGLCLIMQYLLDTRTLVPAVFILAVYIISITTNGYIYGVTSALFSVLMVNFAFTFPFFKFNFTIPENLISALIMVAVALLTSTLATKLKYQESLKHENEQERMRANLLRAVSHDLRTPLTTIYGASSTVVENFDKIDNEQKIQLIKSIRDDSEWLVHLVENLLSVTRIDSGNLKIIKSSVVLEELIDSALVKFKKHNSDREVILSIPEEFVSIQADATLIVQVLVNLLENAVQHAKGMTELHLDVHLKGTTAVFEVWDNGCGISPDRLRNIFNGYFPPMDDIPADGRSRNAGIGLSVCESIIKAHGGNIEADNRPQGGACFRFNLSTEEQFDEQ